MTVTRLKNGKIFVNGKFVKEDLWVSDGKIVDPESLFFSSKQSADVEIDVSGYVIAPGFIDIQLNGGFGVDFSSGADSDEVASGVSLVRRNLLQHGVTGFCPTLITSPVKTYHEVIPKIKKSRGGRKGAAVLGLHLEGPFISLKKKGAHPEEFIRKEEAGYASLEQVYGEDMSSVAIVTLAPEHEYSENVIRSLVEKKIRVNIGHTTATIDCAERAMMQGATGITHLFNAMSSFHHRDPGVVGLLPYGAEGRYKFWYGLIADGHHTHDASMRIAYKTFPKGCVLITDATEAMGLEPGEHHLGEQTVVLNDSHRLTIKGTDTLAGSVATMDLSVRRFSIISGREGAIEAATLHPAQYLGLDHKIGKLDFGFDADFVILSLEMHVMATFIGGKCFYSNGEIDLEVHDTVSS
eukprot:m.24163 g.24163  ORF g.24163 m.24163 type:complete len:409 (-) comp9081_c0_seq1:100-1326(-)